MSTMKRLGGAAVLILTVLAGHPSSLDAQGTAPPSTTAAQDEYVPIDQLPAEDRLPAGPFLVGAYTVAWLAVLIYVWMLWRRLGRVELELREARRANGAR